MTNQLLASQSIMPSAAKAREEESPFIIEFYMVQCIGFQCMAYRDEDGKWRTALDNSELPGDVIILG